MIVPCECGAKLKIEESKVAGKSVKVRCPRCGNIIQVQKQAAPVASSITAFQAGGPMYAARSGRTVLVAHDSEQVRDLARDILMQAGFEVITASDGHEALKTAVELRPQALVLDVGLPGIYGFELCERLREGGQTKDIKIILLTSVYDTSRYKRPPANLYGADDYVERPHITMHLAEKVRALLSPAAMVTAEAPSGTAAAASTETTGVELRQGVSLKKDAFTQSKAQVAAGHHAARISDEEKAGVDTSSWLDSFVHQAQDGAAMAPDSITLESSIFQKMESDLPSVDEADPEAVEKAKRLARIIVSDIALYNPETVIEGIKNGAFHDLLKGDIDEGRELYERRVSPSVRAIKDYYKEAFDNFIDAQKKIVR